MDRDLSRRAFRAGIAGSVGPEKRCSLLRMTAEAQIIGRPGTSSNQIAAGAQARVDTCCGSVKIARAAKK